MALTKNIQTQHGLMVNNAYVRVETASVTKTEMTFNVFSYVDKIKPYFESKSYSCGYDIDGVNPIAQAYEYLKTLPEFAVATDC